MMDRSLWPDGPWTNEPDRDKFEYKGFDCVQVRNDIGTWCGYVGIPFKHPIVKVLKKSKTGYDGTSLEVHGGLTYGAKATDRFTKNRIYIIGFDCGHLGDMWPMSKGMHSLDQIDLPKHMGTVMAELVEKFKALYGAGIYRDLEFVKEQCRSLVDQIIDYKGA